MTTGFLLAEDDRTMKTARLAAAPAAAALAFGLSVVTPEHADQTQDQVFLTSLGIRGVAAAAGLRNPPAVMTVLGKGTTQMMKARR